MIQTRPTRAFAIPVVAANRHHLHQNTRHEHDYPCWQTTAALNTRRLSMPCLSTRRQIQRRPIFLPTTVTRFLFLFSQQSRARKKPPQKSPPPPKYRPFFNHTFRPHLVLDSSAFSAATAINCCPRERRVPSFSAHAKHPFARDSPSKPPLERERERLGPVKSLEELAIRSNYGTRPSVSTTLFSPFRFTNLEHQLIPGKTKLSARIPEEHPTTFLLCSPRSRGRLDVRSKLIRPWKERERHQGARSREHNSTRKRTEGDLISMLILPSHRGPSVFTAVSVARSPPPPRRGIADYGLEPVGPHRAWRPRRGGKEANKYRAIGCSFF